MSLPKYPHIEVQLVGLDGNAIAVINRCVKAAEENHLDEEDIEEFKEEALSGDYDHVLRTCIKWFDAS